MSVAGHMMGIHPGQGKLRGNGDIGVALVPKHCRFIAF